MLAVLISGSGTTLQNLIDLIEAGRLPAKIAGVISSKAEVEGLGRARRHGLAGVVIEWRQYRPDADSFRAEITRQLDAWRPDLVVMAGFIHYYAVPETWANRVINVHPALLPKFGGAGMYGIRVHEAVLKAGETISGCTVHYVDREYDHGPVILQRTVAIAHGESPESLMRKVQAEERIALPEVIRRIALARQPHGGWRME